MFLRSLRLSYAAGAANCRILGDLTNQHVFLTVLGGVQDQSVFRSGIQGGPLLVCRWPLTWWRVGTGSKVSSYEVTYLTTRAPPCDSPPPRQAPPPNTIILGLGLQHRNLGGQNIKEHKREVTFMEAGVRSQLLASLLESDPVTLL